MEVYGIDLGTTYSCIAKYNGSNLEVIQPRGGVQGGTVLPSVVQFEKNSGIPIVGDTAKGNKGVRKFAHQVLSLFKRKMGQDKCDHPILRNGREEDVSPVECSACVLHSLLHSANEQQLAKRAPIITKAVITIPAGFTNKQRDCTKAAAELAGIEVLGLIHEPTAAAISYNIADGETILVFDFGGGTLDVSVVRNQNGKYEVIESCSDIEVLDKYVGGQDWDDKLIDLAIDQINSEIGNSESEEELEKLNRDKNNIVIEGVFQKEGERTKIQLSGAHETTFSYLLDYSTNITRSDFERRTKKMVKDCIKVVKETVEKCQNRGVHIDRCVLAGGSSKMPMIREALQKELGPLIGDGKPENSWFPIGDPENAIAKGAAIYAFLLETKQANIQEKSSHSYGTSVYKDDKDLIHNLIKSTDPMKMNNEVEFNLESGQTSIRVDVYENNSEELDFEDTKSKRKEFHVNKIYDKEYVFDNPRAITNRTKVNFNVLRDKDGRISITVTCPGQHTESHYVDTIHPPITEEVRNQIIQTIKLMDENWGMKGMKKK